jgi:hypothetical protein
VAKVSRSSAPCLPPKHRLDAVSGVSITPWRTPEAILIAAQTVGNTPDDGCEMSAWAIDSTVRDSKRKDIFGTIRIKRDVRTHIGAAIGHIEGALIGREAKAVGHFEVTDLRSENTRARLKPVDAILLLLRITASAFQVREDAVARIR